MRRLHPVAYLHDVEREHEEHRRAHDEKREKQDVYYPEENVRDAFAAFKGCR